MARARISAVSVRSQRFEQSVCRRARLHLAEREGGGGAHAFVLVRLEQRDERRDGALVADAPGRSAARRAPQRSSPKQRAEVCRVETPLVLRATMRNKVSCGIAQARGRRALCVDAARLFCADDFTDAFAGAGFFCADARAHVNKSAAATTNSGVSVTLKRTSERGTDSRRTSFVSRLFGMGLSGANSL